MENPKRLRFIFIGLIGAFFVLTLINYWSVFVPFFIALIIAYILDPLVMFFENCRFRLSRPLATTIVFAFFVVLVFVMFVILYPVLKSGVGALVSTVSGNSKDIEVFFKDAFRWVEDLHLPFKIDKSKLLADLSKTVQGFITGFFTNLSKVALSLLESLPLLLIIPLMVFYFMKDKYRLFAIMKKYTARANEIRARSFFDDVNRQLGGYIRGQALLSLLVFVMTSFAMMLFGIPYPILIGLAGGVLNIVPYFGPVVGAVPALILAIVNHSPYLGGLILFFVVMNVVVAVFLSPKVFSSTTNLHPLLVLFALFLGGQIFGMIGMLIAIPLASVAKTMITLVFDTYIKEI